MDAVRWLNYWRQRGKGYEAAFRRSPAFEVQERALVDRLDGLEFGSVLEVGCGFGRITELVAGRYRDAAYTAVDVSPDMLASAAQKVPRARFIESSILDLDAEGATWDLVLAVEVLMHVPPDEIVATVEKLCSLAAKYLVTVDYAGTSVGLAAHNWAHDWELLLPDAERTLVGGQVINVVTLDGGQL